MSDGRHHDLLRSLEKRLWSLLDLWPSAMAEDLRRYLGARRRKENSMRAVRPYWTLAPCWLFRKYAPGNKWRRKFLQDILWGQHALFMFVRLQDDLFDRQANCTRLIFAADQFQLEAERVFLSYFGNKSPFWKIYHDSVRSTTQAIVEADSLQRSPLARSGRLLSCYARVCSIFKVGSAAMCARAEMMNDYDRISCFSDEMAVVGQVIDDLDDIQEDIERGRSNYAASFFLNYPRSGRSHRGQPLTRVVTSMILTDGVSRLFRLLSKRMKLAEDAVAPLELGGAMTYLRAYRLSLDSMENIFYQQRVKSILGKTSEFKL